MLNRIKENEKLYHNIVFIYTLIFAVYTLFGRFTWLHALVEHTINGAMYIFMGMFGFLLLGIDVLFYHNYRKMKNFPIYLLFILCAAISTALNVKYGIRSNLTTLVWLCVQMGLFTTMGQLFTKERYDKWLTYFFTCSGFIWAFAAVVSLYQYLFVDGYLIYMNKRFLRQSLFDNRLFGVFIDPNLGAFVSFIVIWGMIYLVHKYKNRLVRTLCILNIVIQLFYIILSGSRSTEVCMICSLSYAAIYCLIKYYKKKSVAIFVRILSFIAIPCAIGLVIFSSFSLFRQGSTAVAQLVAPDHHTEVNELVRKDVEGDETNNRLDIWKGYLALMKDKPVFGISPRNAWNYADTEHPDYYIAQHHYDVHNAYVAVLACMGIVGFLALILVMFCILRTVLPRAIDTKQMSMQYFIAIQIILNVAVFICFYPGIYFTNGIDTLLFWPAIGFALQEAKPLRLLKRFTK